MKKKLPHVTSNDIVGEILFALLVRNMTSFCEKSVDTYDALGSALLGLVQ